MGNTNMDEETVDIKKINKKIFSMILPMTIQSILEMVSGIISMGMIGRINPLTVSALGISIRITQIIWALFKGITTGAAVFVAQYYGSNNYSKVKKVIQQTMISAIVLVVVLQLLIYFNAANILTIFNPDEALLDYSVLYLKIASFGLPFFVIILVTAGVLQGMGNARTPLAITIIMNLVNIIVGYVLIFGKFGFTPLGIKGAAIATVCSQVVAAFIALYVLFNKMGILNDYLGKKFFNIDIKQIVSIYRVGLPSSMESIFWQIAAIILTRAILTYGETVFAAHQLGMQAESISYTPAMGFGVAASTFVGQCLGAKEKKLARIYLRQILKGSLAITTVSMVILICFPKFMMSLLTNNKDIIQLGVIYLILMGIVQVPQNSAGVLSGAMRGAGYTKVPMIVAGIGLWGIRVPFTLIVVYLLKMPIIAVWIIMSLDLALRFVISLVLYKKKNIYDSDFMSLAND